MSERKKPFLTKYIKSRNTRAHMFYELVKSLYDYTSRTYFVYDGLKHN